MALPVPPCGRPCSKLRVNFTSGIAEEGIGIGKGGRRAMAPLDFYTLSLKPSKFQKFFHF